MKQNKIKTKDLILRCYANKSDQQWQAFCIDLCLAVQGESFAEVKSKLEVQIQDYVYDALAGEDKEFADYLLNRKAPAKQIFTYYFIMAMHRLGLMKDGLHKLFKEPLPLTPQNHSHA
jgi:hypothetical protein